LRAAAPMANGCRAGVRSYRRFLPLHLFSAKRRRTGSRSWAHVRIMTPEAREAPAQSPGRSPRFVQVSSVPVGHTPSVMARAPADDGADRIEVRYGTFVYRAFRHEIVPATARHAPLAAARAAPFAGVLSTLLRDAALHRLRAARRRRPAGRGVGRATHGVRPLRAMCRPVRRERSCSERGEEHVREACSLVEPPPPLHR
jgi:hypothetical protein